MASQQVSVETGNKVVVVLSCGDADKSGKPDVSVQVLADLPWSKAGLQPLFSLGPWNVPLEQLVSAGRLAAAALPPPARQVADMVLRAVGVAL
jgi:hypothetical protein